MSKLYANFTITDAGKKVIPKTDIFPMIENSISDRLENLVDRLKNMTFQSTFDGRHFEISDTSIEVIGRMIHDQIINKGNSHTLNDFLANFYEPNETDVTQLASTASGPALNLDNLKQYWTPITPPKQGITLTFPGSDNEKQEDRSRLSAYIILWYTIISPGLSSASAGGRKRLSGLRRSSNNKRYKSRRRTLSTRRTKRSTKRSTKRR